VDTNNYENFPILEQEIQYRSLVVSVYPLGHKIVKLQPSLPAVKIIEI
jgi:hypothetical protein